MRKIAKIAVTGVLAGISAGWLSVAAEKPLVSLRLLRTLADEISGEIAFRYTVRISQFDRIQANEGWHDAALWIKGELEKMGYTDAVIEGWPSNGSTRYYTYKTPIGWRAKRAELWMLEPRRERLCSFEEVPLTLIKHSGSGNAEAELVDVGTGSGETAFAGKDVKGKFVLSTGSSAEVMREACQKRAAVGVITYFAPDVRPGFPSMIRYTAFWPRWEDRSRLGLGFNISKNQGAALKRMLEEGRKIVLKADVETEFFETRVEALSVSLPGTDEPDGEVLIVGHLCHPSPGANDNASGSGGMLEMARTLKRLVDTGSVPSPRRTIRFLWVPEFSGTVPYIKAHLDRTRKTLAAVNCDMIGEDLHKTGGTFNITVTPDSLPSYLNDVVVHFTEAVDALNLRSISGSDHPFAWRVEPFGGGSDHYIFNDGALRVPSVMFGHGDTFHHTSLDTPDKVDPSELRRVCAVTLGSVYYLASAGRTEAADMARLIARNGAGRLAADASDAMEPLLASGSAGELGSAHKQALNVIGRALTREKQAVLSTAAFTPDKDYPARATAWTAPLEALAVSYEAAAGRIYREACVKLKIRPEEPKMTEDERTLAKIIPLRSPDFVCPLETDYLVEKVGPAVTGRLKLRGYVAYEAVNFADGRRSIYDITQAVAAEYGPQNMQGVYDFFKVLEEAGLFSLSGVAPAASIERVTVVEEGGYFPVAIRLASGEILAVLRGGGAHIGREGRLDLVISSNQGRTWSRPWAVVDGPEDDRNPALGQLADGTILLAYAVLTGYEADGLKLSGKREDRVFDGVYVMRSKDKGKTWSKPERSPAIYAFYQGRGAVSPYGKIVQLKDGTVMMAVYFEFFGGRGNESYIFRSRDGGLTWGEPTRLGEHFNETALLELSDGRLLAAMRSEKGGHIAVTQSADGGKTWSPAVQVTKNLEHPADLILLKSGGVLMTYGERNAPMGARAVFSRDGGKTWDIDRRVILAEAAPNTDCGYPSSVEAADGQIVSLYYQVDDLKNAPHSARCVAVLWRKSE